MVHIDELFGAFQTFTLKVNMLRQDQPDEWQQGVLDAQAEFKAFCEKHNLPVDFSKR